MILRKPYRFLIKYFRTTHLTIVGIMIYLLVKNNTVYKFFRFYSATSTMTLGSLKTYATRLMLFAIFGLVLICVVVFLLMRQKKKPTVVYITMIVGYTIMLGLFWYLRTVILGLINEPVTAREAMLYRDLSLIAMSFQYVMLGFMLARAFGFDVKKFNFGDDLRQLEINAEDSEEFELELGIDKNKVSRRLRKTLREARYYILENKYIFMIIVGSLIVGYSIFLSTNINNNKTFQQSEVINYNYMNFMVKDSFLSKEDYQGNIIINNNNFIIVKTIIKPRGNDLTLKKESFSLVGNNSTYYPSLKYCELFSDIGTCYKDSTINKDTSSEYIFIYNIEGNKEDTLMFRYNEDSLVDQYTKIRLNPIKLDKEELVSEYDLTHRVITLGSILTNSEFVINSYELNSNFNYSYDYCYDVNNCTNHTILIIPSNITSKDKMIMKLNMEILLKENRVYNLSNFDFINNFGSITYEYNGNNYILDGNFVNKTPSNYSGNDVYIEVSNILNSASHIWLTIDIRDKQYKYVLK